MSSNVIKLDQELNNSFYNFKNSNSLKNKVKIIKKKLDYEDGFVVLKGFEVKKYNLSKISKSYTFLMSKLGIVLSQNKKKEKIVKVENLGKNWSANNRGYKTKENINFHTDGGTYAGLMCIRKPKSGGENLVTSSEKVYYHFKKNYPAELKILEEGFHYHTRGENKGKERITKKKYPIFFKSNNLIHCMFNKNPIVWAYNQISMPKSKKKTILKILNLFEKISNIKKNIIFLKLEEGDILLVNNYKVLHARKKFTDSKKKRRLLLRAWVKSVSTKYKGPTLLDVYNNR